MPSRDYHEALWEGAPASLHPPALDVRERFLIGNLADGARVLDLGCGEGRLAAALLRAGAEVVAVDVAEEPLRRARRRLPGLDARLIDGEGAWELPDSHFDVVWAGEVIEHVADTAGWLSELRRVLRPGGTLLLSTPAHGRRELLRLALTRSWFEARFDPLGDHLRFYSPASLRRLLEQFRFERVEVGVSGRPWSASRGLLARAIRSRW